MEISKENSWRLLQLRVFEKHITEAVVFFRLHGIEPILIKGWVTAQTYPDPAQRGYTDIDLIIAPDKYDDAVDLIEGYHGKMPLDLHKGAKFLDTLAYENLFNNSKTVMCGGLEIRILSAEDHLRILCVHWLIGGAEKNRLWDIYYAVENRPPDFDWDKCLNAVNDTRRKWIICAIGLAQKYLGLSLENTPLAGKTVDIPEWIIKAVEKEWRSEIRLVSLEHCLRDGKILWQQIKKRLPPNPIQATIDMEGEFDNRPRIIYQVGNVFQRLGPAIRRIVNKVSFVSKNQ
ncbi:MAG TPA: nucleotidyltransferase family protein [Pyrinomonadaceae bacterium]|nr:nucleotidyltransferase family protein [Pyrinomonadaceae bacterium]